MHTSFVNAMYRILLFCPTIAAAPLAPHTKALLWASNYLRMYHVTLARNANGTVQYTPCGKWAYCPTHTALLAARLRRWRAKYGNTKARAMYLRLANIIQG